MWCTKVMVMSCLRFFDLCWPLSRYKYLLITIQPRCERWYLRLHHVISLVRLLLPCPAYLPASQLLLCGGHSLNLAWIAMRGNPVSCRDNTAKQGTTKWRQVRDAYIWKSWIIRITDLTGPACGNTDKVYLSLIRWTIRVVHWQSKHYYPWDHGCCRLSTPQRGVSLSSTVTFFDSYSYCRGVV